MAEGWSQMPDLPGDEVHIVDLHRIAIKRQQSPPALAIWARRPAEAPFDVARDHLLEIRGQGRPAQGCGRHRGPKGLPYIYLLFTRRHRRTPSIVISPTRARGVESTFAGLANSHVDDVDD